MAVHILEAKGPLQDEGAFRVIIEPPFPISLNLVDFLFIDIVVLVLIKDRDEDEQLPQS